MSAISGITSQVIPNFQVYAPSKTTPVAPAQPVQTNATNSVKDSDGNRYGSKGNNIDTYA